MKNIPLNITLQGDV